MWNALPDCRRRAAADRARRRLGGRADWEKRVAFARQRIEAAARAGRIVAIRRHFARRQEIAPLDAAEIEGRLRALAPVPYAPQRAADAMPAIEQFPAAQPKTEIVWIADGVELGGASGFAARARGAAPIRRGRDRRRRRSRIAGAENEAGALAAHLIRSDARAAGKGAVRALDAQGRAIGEAPFDFGSSARDRTARSICRSRCATKIAGSSSTASGPPARPGWSTNARAAGASRSLPGASADVAQPLLSPIYYLKRALAPFADISEWRDSASDPILSLLAEKPSVLALADMSVRAGPGARRDSSPSRRGRRAAALRRHAARRRRRRPDADRAAARRPHARRRAVLGDAQAHRAFDKAARSSASPRPTR